MNGSGPFGRFGLPLSEINPGEEASITNDHPHTSRSVPEEHIDVHYVRRIGNNLVDIDKLHIDRSGNIIEDRNRGG